MVSFHMFQALTTIGEPRTALLSGDVPFGNKTFLIGRTRIGIIQIGVVPAGDERGQFQPASRERHSPFLHQFHRVIGQFMIALRTWWWKTGNERSGKTSTRRPVVEHRRVMEAVLKIGVGEEAERRRPTVDVSNWWRSFLVWSGMWMFTWIGSMSPWPASSREGAWVCCWFNPLKKCSISK